MGKKQNKKETIEMIEVEQEIVKDEPKNIPLTHQALSMVKDENGKYTIVSIKFNPKENAVGQTIEHIESNTDMYIIQERLSVLLYDIENLAIGNY